VLIEEHFRPEVKRIKQLYILAILFSAFEIKKSYVRKPKHFMATLLSKNQRRN